jgi:hypothetical protein
MHMFTLIIIVLVAYAFVYLTVKAKPEWFLGERHEQAGDCACEKIELVEHTYKRIADDALLGPSSANQKSINTNVGPECSPRI